MLEIRNDCTALRVYTAHNVRKYWWIRPKIHFVFNFPLLLNFLEHENFMGNGVIVCNVIVCFRFETGFAGADFANWENLEGFSDEKKSSKISIFLMKRSNRIIIHVIDRVQRAMYGSSWSLNTLAFERCVYLLQPGLAKWFSTTAVRSSKVALPCNDERSLFLAKERTRYWTTCKPWPQHNRCTHLIRSHFFVVATDPHRTSSS